MPALRKGGDLPPGLLLRKSFVRAPRRCLHFPSRVGQQEATKPSLCFLSPRALKALWSYLTQKGVNSEAIWEKIKDIVIKTIIA